MAPASLQLGALTSAFITHFLEHLEQGRGNTARTRNIRLAAIRSFFHYVALLEPAYLLDCTRILAIPSKRHDKRAIFYLEPTETKALLDAVPLDTWLGRRDRALLLVAAQCGLRVSELIGLRRADLQFGTGAHVRCCGKGRKERCTPLRRETQRVLADWLRERQGCEADPVFATAAGSSMSRDAVERLVTKYALRATQSCPTLHKKRVTPHVLRHTAAMDLLRHGVDRSVIALWLGHESVETTQIYLHADLGMKQAALARTEPLGVRSKRFRPGDELVAFLEAL